MKPKHNKIWIELDEPKDAEHAKAMCYQANNMLHRLGDTGGREFWWDVKERQYCFGGDMGYVTLPDRGTWFNLDYLGRGD